eukprot:TRINITY_DN4464_c0_g1_i2.p1 TRINITY_DN4464_c0_g1~~TRINITY_DN4464_c0_g1_i2.p1  ORF type:complete len:437 (+),score=94.07 TRINITY_DN4464_c0_g1_i2:85-1395(+)
MPRPREDPLAGDRADMFFGDIFGGKGGGGGYGADEEGGFHEEDPKDKVDNTRFYELLEVSTDASSSEIKKAYHRQAMKHHPDKGGDPETFKDIQRAFEVLSDPEQRQRYDSAGEEGLNEDGPSSPHGLFEQLFGKGKGGKGRGRGQRPRTENVFRPIWVTLEELYTGVTRKLPIMRKVVDESGGQSSSCSACGGQGRVVQMIRMGPIIQQVQQVCPKCGGSGSQAKMKTLREVLEVFVEKGTPDGHKIVIHGKANEAPGCEPGDVIVQVRQQEHSHFLRREADLYMQEEITLAEALTGFRRVISHLDGHKILVRSKPGETIRPSGSSIVLRGVRDAGMPIHQDPFNFGNLFLVLSVRFPEADELDEMTAPQLCRLLGASEPSKEVDGGQGEHLEEALAEDIDPVESSKRSKKVTSEAYDEDDERGGMPGGVECRQQ